MPFAVIRSSESRQSPSASFSPPVISHPAIRIAVKRVVLEYDHWADEGLNDHDTDGTLVEAADKHTTSANIDDANYDSEDSDDERSDTDASFDDLGDVPHKSSASYPNSLFVLGDSPPPRQMPTAGSPSGPSEWRRRIDTRRSEIVASRLQRTKVHRVSGYLRRLRDDHDECSIQAAPASDAVHGVPSTQPAKARRPRPPVEAPNTASPPAAYIPKRELQARKDNCASLPDTPRDGGAARALAVLRKRVDESSARNDELPTVRRRIFTLRATRGEDDAAPPMPDSEVFAVREDDTDALKMRSWSSLWHDVLCGGGGGGSGADGIDEPFDVDDAVEGGMCCACDLMALSTVGDAAPVEIGWKEGTATDTAATMTLKGHFDERTMVRVLA